MTALQHLTATFNPRKITPADFARIYESPLDVLPVSRKTTHE